MTLACLKWNSPMTVLTPWTLQVSANVLIIEAVRCELHLRICEGFATFPSPNNFGYEVVFVKNLKLFGGITYRDQD
jgi:hypothetical protein